MEWIYLAVPAISAVIALVIAGFKAIQAIPVNSQNAKWFAFGIAVLFVVVTAWGNGTLLEESQVAANVADIVLLYGGAVAFYETFKRLINKLTGWVFKDL